MAERTRMHAIEMESATFYEINCVDGFFGCGLVEIATYERSQRIKAAGSKRTRMKSTRKEVFKTI